MQNLYNVLTEFFSNALNRGTPFHLISKYTINPFLNFSNYFLIVPRKSLYYTKSNTVAYRMF